MTAILDAITPIMNASIGLTAARGVFRTLPRSVTAEVGSLDVLELRELLSHLETSGKLFAMHGKPLPIAQLRQAMTGGGLAREKVQRFTIASDGDVLVVQRATQALTKAFFSMTDCVRLATAVSELARNIYMYAKTGSVTLKLADEPTHWRFELSADDHGPGIPNLEVIMSGAYKSRTGLGRGIVGTKALLDEMKVESAPGKGTHITGLRRARKT
ncbi:MAG: ATP-binding protein [Archangium sp.]